MNKNDMKSINYRLWLALILASLMPLIYSTTRIYFLGSIPDTWTFSIAAQSAWLNVGYEVINEALLIPLYYILGKALSDELEFSCRARQALKIMMSIYFFVTIFVILFTPELVVAMKQKKELFEITVQYIRLESLAILISGFYSFLLLAIVLNGETILMYRLLFVQMILMVFFDSLLVSQLPFSFGFGVIGVAISNIAVNLLLSAIAVIYFYKYGFFVKSKKEKVYNREWVKEWMKIGWKSGLESFVRNVAFIIMILQLVNEVQAAGTYWVANQFIWGWLLLPVLTLGKLVTQDAAINSGMSTIRINSYLWLIFGIILIWGITSPVWSGFIANVMGVENYNAVIDLVWFLIVFYVIFSFNHVIDSYFYGVGRTDLMLYQSLIVNIFFYGSAFAFYQIGIFIPNLETISLMFGAGIAFDAVITWLLYYFHQQDKAKSIVIV